MKRYSVWKSEYTGEVYELPERVTTTKFGGWIFLGFIEK